MKKLMNINILFCFGSYRPPLQTKRWHSRTLTDGAAEQSVYSNV